MNRTTLLIAMIVSFASIANAQPPRPAEQPRSVTLTLDEYNRLLDLERRAPAVPASAPVGAALSSATMRITVDGVTARGAFALAGQVLHSGVTRVPLVSGTALIDVTFPSIGPSLFMASELTAEGQAPSFDLSIRRIK